MTRQMVTLALVHGAVAGALVIGFMILSFTLTGSEGIEGSQLLGYLVMIVALSMIFIGVKRHRDRDLGGTITFGRAFMLGLAMALVASVVYVVLWEIYLAAIDYQFIDQYAAAVIEARRAEGVSGSELDALIAQMNTMKANYANPLFRLPVTFLEIFPIALIVALVSAAILRNPSVLPARARGVA